VVPFPYSLPIIIGVVIMLSLFVRRKLFKKMGTSGTSMFGGLGSGSGVRYYCMSCGAKHNEIACPKCGSKMKSWFLTEGSRGFRAQQGAPD